MFQTRDGESPVCGQTHVLRQELLPWKDGKDKSHLLAPLISPISPRTRVLPVHGGVWLS